MCEAEFVKLDVRIVASGGSTSVQTHSRKNILTTNRLLSDPYFTMLSESEKRQKFKWARCSDNVLKVKEGRNFYLTIHSTHFIYGYMASDIWLRTILIV